MEKLIGADTFFGKNNGNIHALRPFIEDGVGHVLNFKGNGDRSDLANYEKKLVNNATLRWDEWRTLDEVVQRIAEQRLVGYEDLRTAGLVKTINNPMATTVLTWEQMSDALSAEIGMDPVVRGQNDQPEFNPQHLPLPVVFADYSINERLLQNSRQMGESLETINAERAARHVSVKLEDMLFGATASFSYGGGTIHSYISHPDNNDLSFASGDNHWDAAAKTGVQIKDDVLNMIDACIADNYYGPWMLYIPTGYQTTMGDDYSVSGASLGTIGDRLKAIEGIIDIKVVDRLPADTVLLVTMQSDVVDLVDGFGFQNIQWDSEGGMVHNYKVMTIQIPRVKSDYELKSGIVVLS